MMKGFDKQGRRVRWPPEPGRSPCHARTPRAGRIMEFRLGDAPLSEKSRIVARYCLAEPLRIWFRIVAMACAAVEKHATGVRSSRRVLVP